MSIPLSLQLYTVREALTADLDAAIDRVAEIGYTIVEPYGFAGTEGPLAGALKRNGLAAPTGHAPLLTGDLDTIFTSAQNLGMKTVICPSSVHEAWQTKAGIEEIANGLNQAAEKAKEYGMTVGYHNHWFELEPRVDGQHALEVLPSLLSPEVVLEVDTYWAAVGGADPVELLGRLGDRVRYIHIKDGDKTRNNKAQVAVGQGIMPIWDVMAAAKDIEIAVVELDDCSTDMFAAVADSLSYLKAGPQG